MAVGTIENQVAIVNWSTHELVHTRIFNSAAAQPSDENLLALCWFRQPRHSHYLLAASSTGRAAVYDVDVSGRTNLSTSAPRVTVDIGMEEPKPNAAAAASSDSKAGSGKSTGGSAAAAIGSGSGSESKSSSFGHLFSSLMAGRNPFRQERRFKHRSAASAAGGSTDPLFEAFTYPQLAHDMTSVHVNCDDTLIVASGYTKSVNIFDLETGKMHRSYQNVHKNHGRYTALSPSRFFRVRLQSPD